MACNPEIPKEERRKTGKCHVCKLLKSIGFCNLCCHWFCNECNRKWFARGIEAVKERVRGMIPGCCGPKE